MIRRALAVVLLLAGVAVAAPGDTDRLHAEIRRGTRAMEHATHLSERIGPRLTGSANLEKAASWAAGRFEAFGLERVRLEPAGTFPVGFDRHRTAGRMITPESKPLACGTEAWSAGTNGPLRGAVRRTPPTAEWIGGRPDLTGAWVLVPSANTADPSTRAMLLAALRGAGALGALLASPDERILAGGRPPVSTEEIGTFPAVTLAKSAWEELDSLAERGAAPIVEFDIAVTVTAGPRPIANVTAEIRGAERPDEIVIVGGHLDSWDLATGATDNGAGVATTLEAARLLAASGVRPARTIRFVLFTGEEQGLIGSNAYAAAHADELARISAVLIQDRGADAISGIEAPAAIAAALRDLFAPLASLDARRPFAVHEVAALAPDALAACLTSCANPTASCAAQCAGSAPASCAPGSATCNTGSASSASCAPGAAACSAGSACPSDHWPFLQAGVPAFLWRQDGTGYERTHHTHLDRLDALDPGAVEHSARIVALAALRVADAPALLPRESGASAAAKGVPAAPSR